MLDSLGCFREPRFEACALLRRVERMAIAFASPKDIDQGNRFLEHPRKNILRPAGDHVVRNPALGQEGKLQGAPGFEVGQCRVDCPMCGLLPCRIAVTLTYAWL